MLKIELSEYGLDDTLNDIRGRLRGALGKKVSKKNKDTAIREAIASLEAIRNMIYIEEVEISTESEASNENIREEN